MSLSQLIALAALGGASLCAIMTAAWLLQRTTGNSGWIDVTWSLGVGGVGCCFALVPLQSEWPHWRQVAIAVMIFSWSVRLGLHIARRTQGVSDDPRYRDLIVRWGDNAPRRLFLFVQSQAVVGTLLVLSVAVAAHNSDPALRFQDVLASAIFIVALVGESLADRQLAQFRTVPENRRRICDVGLWRLSRHPNYFFEWLGWISYPIAAIDLTGSNAWGPLALAAPVCMYWVLVGASGIPPLEEHMLRTRGDIFRAYQRRTRPFLPLPYRKGR